MRVYKHFLVQMFLMFFHFKWFHPIPMRVNFFSMYNIIYESVFTINTLVLLGVVSLDDILGDLLFKS